MTPVIREKHSLLKNIFTFFNIFIFSLDLIVIYDNYINIANNK